VKLGITMGFETGICSICKKEKNVRIIYDEDSNKIVKICEECAEKFGERTSEEIMNEFGKEE